MMISLVEAQATASTPPSKKQKVEDPPPQVEMLEIEDSDLEEESLPISFSCLITILVTLPAIISVTKASVDPLGGLVDDNSFLNIHFP